jgi:CubicO group peptidase (beta-lactamase class C family)
MTQNTDRSSTPVKKRRSLLVAAILVTFTLAMAACSSSGTTSQQAEVNDPTPAAPQPTAVQPTPPATATPAPSPTTPPTATPTPTTPPPAPTEETNTAADVDALLDELDAFGFDGVVAVRSGSEIITRALGLADRENDVATDVDTVFDIGSVSKQFTGAAILRLEMDGRLSVDDTLGQHVPGLPADKAAITLHQLLTHTAGFPTVLGPDDEPITRSDFLRLVGETPLLGEPGERYSYSNPGYSLLAAAIEFETGTPYEQYIRTALFEPAGMLDTGYRLADWDGHTIAVGYQDPSGERFGRPNERPWDADGPYWNLLGNGGLLSTAADMLRWDQALLGDDILDAASKAKFFGPHVPDAPNPNFHYGYGWQVLPTPFGTPLITHNGGNGVFYAEMLRFAEQDVAVFVATNTYQADGIDSEVASEVANTLFDGQLAAFYEEQDEPAEPSEGNCGFDGLTIDSLPTYPELESLPDSAVGLVTAELLELLGGFDDDAALLDFAADHVTSELGGDSPEAFAAGVAEVSNLLADYDVSRVLEQDDHRLHLLLQGQAGDLLLSIGVAEADPERLACLALTS